MNQEIIKNIINNQSKILSNINDESISVYIFLKNEYKKGGIKENTLFQFVFRSFYRLDNAGLGDEIKNKYFKLLSNKNVNLEMILCELYEIPTKRNLKTIQFSFATKLLHTIDNHLPIYDAEASRILGVRVSGKTKDEKIKSCIGTYEKMKSIYLEIIDDKEILKLIKKFKERFKLKDNEITNEKILDFIIWSLGKLNNK